MPETLEAQDTPVFSYMLASADMRYIGNSERQIYLRNDPQAGLVFRGELTGCGPGCFVNLSQVLLEYAMSCDGCGEQRIATEQAIHFGENLGEILIKKTGLDAVELPATEKLSTAFKYVLNSMNAKYIEEENEDRLEYSLDHCPLHECAQESGLGLNVELAHLTFTALCKTLIKKLGPDWVLVQPSTGDTKDPINKIVIAHH